jgi:DNA-binding GntR family transcriptional regulator
MIRTNFGGTTIATSVIKAIAQAATLRSTVEESLASAIISGELEPGTLVSVPTLAQQFAVSATPVREAMLNLEKRGFVEPVKNKGFRVTQVSEDDLRELVQLRRWLEPPAMILVAERLKGTPLDSYCTLVERIASAAKNARFREYLAADTEFHLALLRATGNQRLVDIVAELRQQTRMIGLTNLIETRELDESASEHHTLLTLLSEGKGEEAKALLERHVAHAAGWWAGVREESGAGHNT